MGDLVNLNRARKARARAAARRQADANAVRFGRSKAERQAGVAKTRLEAARLEAHRCAPDDGPEREGP